jgi:hypothetical protein
MERLGADCADLAPKRYGRERSQDHRAAVTRSSRATNGPGSTLNGQTDRSSIARVRSTERGESAVVA